MCIRDSIKNTIWAYILPNFLLGAFNIILVRTFFSTSIPNDIYEAAKIDGAGYPTIYWKIVLPLGKPILVTIGRFAGLSYWNDWTNAQYYISDSRMLSVQALLNRMVQDIQALLANSSAKLEKKNLDMVVANNLKVAGAGFGVDTNVVTFITPDGVRELPLMSKDDVADAILDEILKRRK